MKKKIILSLVSIAAIGVLTSTGVPIYSDSIVQASIINDQLSEQEIEFDSHYGAMAHFGELDGERIFFNTESQEINIVISNGRLNRSNPVFNLKVNGNTSTAYTINEKDGYFIVSIVPKENGSSYRFETALTIEDPVIPGEHINLLTSDVSFIF